MRTSVHFVSCGLTAAFGVYRGGVPMSEAGPPRMMRSTVPTPVVREPQDNALRRAGNCQEKWRTPRSAFRGYFANSLQGFELRCRSRGTRHCAHCADPCPAPAKNVALDRTGPGTQCRRCRLADPQEEDRVFLVLQCNGRKRSQILGDPNPKSTLGLEPARVGRANGWGLQSIAKHCKALQNCNGFAMELQWKT